MMRVALVLGLAILSVGVAIGQGQAQSAPRSTIRVGLWTLWQDKEATIAPISHATVQWCATCASRPLAALAIQVSNAGLIWIGQDGHKHSSTESILRGSYKISAHGETLTLAYPLRIVANRGRLVLVATLPVERYVEHVVAAESGAADSQESRKALAVVARSFALRPSHGHADFDVCDSTHCQWVHWHTTPEAHAATLATADESLWFHGSRAEAFFHQNCGGRTAATAEVWPGHFAPTYLVSHADTYCSRAGSSEWSATLSRAELTLALAAAGLVAPGWKTLAVAQRGESGRAVTLLVGSAQISTEDFRLVVGRAMGWNHVRSNWFEIASQGDDFLFHGRGSGHGVGLCQVGAAEMARAGKDYRAILAQYFPGTAIAEETTGTVWQVFVRRGFTFEISDAGDIGTLPELERALAEAESRSGLTPRSFITVRSYRSTSAFRDATLAPGWVAAFTEGDQIELQPLRILAVRKLLAPVARHEFLHALVEEEATAHTPLWLREGVVEAWSDDEQKGAKPALTPEAINEKLAHAASEAESEAAHRAAGWYAQKLLDRFGRAQVLEWLRAGPPQLALGSLR